MLKFIHILLVPMLVLDSNPSSKLILLYVQVQSTLYTLGQFLFKVFLYQILTCSFLSETNVSTMAGNNPKNKSGSFVSIKYYIHSILKAESSLI